MLRSVFTLLSASLVLSIFACGGATRPGGSGESMLGKTVNMALPSDRGALGALPAPGAKFTVAYYFAPTCRPCRETVPRLVARKASIEQSGGRFVLIAVLGSGESSHDARQALRSWGVGDDEAFLVDNGDASGREAGVRYLPTMLVLDASGVVRWVGSPQATADDVVAAARSPR